MGFRRTFALLFAAFLLLSVGASAAQAQTYPVNSTFEVRDANGNLITTDVGLYPGDPFTVTAGGWMPGTTVTVTFHSDPILLGTLVADAQGNVRGDYRVPEVPPGIHIVRLEGTGADGKPRTLEWAMRVLARAVVAGSSIDAPGTNGAVGGTASGSSAFGKTGIDAQNIAAFGFALLAVGAALVVAVRRQRATATR
ncbi:MAG: hypothetical protein QOI61_2648 [Actinomycetota bacterium]